MFIDVVNKEKREATMRLYGVIGKAVNGGLFAQEMASLDGRVDTVHLHINSPGGSVDEGLSIVSVMLSMRAFVVVHVDGIAASMAAVIAVCGDRVEMMDFGKLMIHDPFFDPGGDKNLSNKQRKTLSSLTDTLRTILSRRGCDKKKISKLMTEETWFSAEEAKTENLIDEVISSRRKKDFENLSTDEILSRIGNEYKPTIKNETMDLKKIAAGLGLPDTATEAEILAKVKELQKAGTDEQKALITAYMALGEKLGTVTDKNKKRMERLAAADFDLFAEMVTEVPEEEEDEEDEEEKGKAKVTKGGDNGDRLSAAISAMQKAVGVSGGANEKTWDWYQKNDPQALISMEKEDEKKFNALRDAYENSL